MTYETITFENINEFVDNLEIKNKDNFKIDFSRSNFVKLLSNDKDDFVRFNIVVMYHNTNRDGELMFSKQNLTDFKNKIKFIEKVFDFKKFITNDMNIEFIFIIDNTNTMRFNLILTSDIKGTNKYISVKAIGNALTFRFSGQGELSNARGELINWDFYGDDFEINTDDFTNQEIINEIVTTTQTDIIKFDANAKILMQMLNLK